ncbi:hypothetical protein BAUCODRAFT_34755 [Baudoinia panamericana UAMH 10762]|uniref:Uncharacterized protein n=1 Tax=Baudoinia panamericana (strain UAMH 10762) TaxID=717646 RepID=M2MHC3_BAUPA|nr:uncharacterized protein BAUCODRAFT_34755 [Baudoinia panamericana UAMH 10762]EMC95991.1 hypothetical protein BAUCODRAFT_34755 [Baudoinia panamericana UAMH 10762]
MLKSSPGSSLTGSVVGAASGKTESLCGSALTGTDSATLFATFAAAVAVSSSASPS